MNAPTLYIMGEEDHMFLPPVRKIVQKFERSYLEVVENSGHVVNIDKPEQFNNLSLAFLRKQSAAEGMTAESA